ncbi:MAG: CbbQ/NirQ/NorQ/GpvN family protein [Saprospiraceae bacterium]|nr:CbbQ/NirQ/NorQ/GpvN family protein [Saprospiraceae bacterium]
MINTIQPDSIRTLPYYRAIGKEKEIFNHVYECRLPLLLKGPTGCGKSRFIEHMASSLQQEMITVSCHEETSATDLIGRFIIKGSETIWMDGPLTESVKKGAILYLDEIAEARPDVIVAIHSLTDHRRELYIDKLGTRIKAHENFLFVASFNPGYQRGYKELKPSTRQRFVAFTFQYPNAKVEVEILMNESGIEEPIAKQLVDIGQKIRNLKELGLTETASTRLLVDAAHLIVSGLPKRLSVKVAIIEPLTDEPEIIDALTDTCNLLI